MSNVEQKKLHYLNFRSSSGRPYSTLFIAVLFALALSVVPWETLFGIDFVDKANYFQTFLGINYSRDFEWSWDYFGYAVFSEQLWNTSIRWLNVGLGIPIEHIFSGISVFTLSTMAFFLSRKIGMYSVLLLINPIIINFTFSQYRSAVATAIILIYYMNKESIHRRIGLLSTPFIHTASVLIWGVTYFCDRIAATPDTKWKPLVKISLAIGLGLGVSIIIGPLREIILTFFSDRRAVSILESQSFLYISFWVILLLAQCVQAKHFVNNSENLISIAALSIVFFSTVMEVSASRFLAIFFVFIIVSLFNLKPLFLRYILLFGLFSFTGMQWAYWFGVYI